MTLLTQPDFGGNDYEDGLKTATVFCEECDGEEEGVGRCYVTEMCEGGFESDCGKASTENNLFAFFSLYPVVFSISHFLQSVNFSYF
jgi:hypothetical protein